MVYITVNTFPGLRSIRIDEAVYYPTFIYNVVLLDRLKKRLINEIRTLIINILKTIIKG